MHTYRLIHPRVHHWQPLDSMCRPHSAARHPPLRWGRRCCTRAHRHPHRGHRSAGETAAWVVHALVDRDCKHTTHQQNKTVRVLRVVAPTRRNWRIPRQHSVKPMRATAFLQRILLQLIATAKRSREQLLSPYHCVSDNIREDS